MSEYSDKHVISLEMLYIPLWRLTVLQSHCPLKQDI